MTTYTLHEQYLYGKPTGNIEVHCPDGRVVTFRKHLRERKADVRARANAWIAQGAKGIPGAPAIGHSRRYRA